MYAVIEKTTNSCQIVTTMSQVADIVGRERTTIYRKGKTQSYFEVNGYMIYADNKPKRAQNRGKDAKSCRQNTVKSCIQSNNNNKPMDKIELLIKQALIKQSEKNNKPI